MHLHLAVTPSRLPSDAPVEVTLTLTLRHRGLLPVTLHAEQAQLSVASGWAGPWWDLTLLCDGVPQPTLLRELRTWYGPPGMLPTDDVFVGQRLRRGGQHVTTLPACWLPPAALTPAERSLERLDPQGMDALAPLREVLADCGVLVLRRTLADVQARRARGEDVLRPAQLLFVPWGHRHLALQAGYRQHARRPLQGDVSARSEPVPLVLSLAPTP